MEIKISAFKAKISSLISSALSVAGIGSGGAGAVCQTTCSTSPSVLPILGVSLAATPFAFIEDYQLFIWWFASAIFAVLFLFFINKKLNSKTDRAFLFINAGLLVIGFPYLKEEALRTFLVWIGVLAVFLGVFLLLTAKKLSVQFTK